MRHRRRCQGPSNPQTRRKACNACVQAKTKCCYRQPTCTRCAKRGQPCVYVSNSNNTSTDSAVDLSEPSDGTDTPTSDPQAALFQSGKFGTTTEPLELPLWDSPLSSWPLDTFDMSLSTAIQPAVSLPGLNSADPPEGTTTSLSFPNSGAIAGLHSRSGSVMSLSSTSWNIPLPIPIAPPTNDNARPPGSTPSPTSSLDLVHLLGKYPNDLLREEFTTPFLHQTLYSDAVPDMTSLPLTSMAICCGSGVNFKESIRFVRRAMDAERQRLIEAFVSIATNILLLGS